MEQRERSLSEEVEALEKAIEASKKEHKGATLMVDDLMELAGKYLSDAAKKALSKKGKNLIESYNEQVGKSTSQDGMEQSEYIQKHAICQYHAVCVRVDKIEDGVKAISESMNELAAMGAIHSCLAPVSSIKLVQMPFEMDKCAVFCFAHIKPEFAEVAKNVKYRTLEGGVGENLHSFDIELPPGEFLAECRLTHQLAMMAPAKSKESRIFDQVKEFLKFLPEGTEFLGYRSTAIMDLSMPFELKFRNPLLQKVKRVELEYVREVALAKEGENETLKQFNLVLGIRYLGVRYDSKDGKIEDLYSYRRD